MMELTELEAKVLNCLEIKSADHPATRTMLKARTKDTDRAIRDAICHLRKKRKPIVSMSGKSGYFLAETPAQLAVFIGEMGARARDIEETIDALTLTGVDMFGEDFIDVMYRRKWKDDVL